MTALVLVLVGSLAGCADARPAEPTAAEREAAAGRVEALGPEVWDLGEPLASAGQDVCQEGQQNWKVEEVDSACTVGRSWILPAARSRADVAGAIDAMRARLAGLDCEPVGSDALDRARRYWADGVQDEPGKLPGARFTCGDARVEVSSVSPAEPRVTPISLVGDLTGGDVGEPRTEEFPADVEQSVQGSGRALLWQITVTQQYAVRR